MPVLAGLAACYALSTYQVYMDDFYITLRYAANLAAGKGFVFNEGEKVLGTTTPLLAILSAACIKIGISPVWSLRLINALALFGAAIFCFLYFKQKGNELIGYAAGLALFVFLLLKQLWGNEVPLCFFCIMASLYFYEKEKWTASAIFQCFYALTRMEGMLFYLLLTGYLFLRKKRIMYGALIPGLLILAPWFIFSKSYFGDFFPNTLYAKARQGIRPDRWISFARGFFSTLKEFFLNKNSITTSFFALGGLIFFPYKKYWMPLVWCVIHQGAYWYLGVPGSYRWYYYTLWLLYPFMMGAGIYGIARFLRGYLLKPIPEKVLYSLFLALLLWRLWALPDMNIFNQERYNQSIMAINQIRQKVPKGNKILADEIGIFGYYLPEYLFLDPAGLIHRNMPKEAFYRYDYLAAMYRPMIIINSHYMKGDETLEKLNEPISFKSVGEGASLYEVMFLVPGKDVTLRVFKRILK